MSSVTVLNPPSIASFQPPSSTQTCHQCGADLSHTHPGIAEDAQRRISELEAQVKILTGKATAAVDRLADYEDEIRRLKSTHPSPPTPTTPRPSRISQLLPARATSTPPTTSAPPSSDYQALYTHEQTLRLAAESRITQTNSEIEELSAQLFTEANEMVAAERRARVKLEERVAVLERRDREKRGRLGELEGRLGRIERVRGLLGAGNGV